MEIAGWSVCRVGCKARCCGDVSRQEEMDDARSGGQRLPTGDTVMRADSIVDCVVFLYTV